MLSGIRGRLLLSYVLVLLVTLSAMTGAFVLFLSSRPAISDEQVIARLARFAADEVNRSPVRSLVAPLLRDDPTLDDFPYAQTAEEAGVRLLLVQGAPRGGITIIEDSAGRYAPGDVPELLQRQPIQLREVEQAEPGIVSRGVFREGDENWVFLAFQPTQPRERTRRGGNAPTPGSNALIFASTHPNTPLLTALQQFGNNLGIPLLQAAGVGLLVAGVMSVLITRTIAQPLRRLAGAAAAVADGDYGHSVPQQGPREIQEVARAFNSMSKQVKLNNQAQRELLENVSHDLKTPLTSIQGFSQAIVDGAAQDPAKAAAVLFYEAGRLTRLVEQLTELARLKAGRLTMRQDELDVGEVVSALAQKIDVVAQKKGIQLHTNVVPTPSITGDGDQLAQVITNLLSNAVKYTPEGGQVLAAVQPNGNGVNITVRDTGVGISEEDLSRVFERFYQVNKSRGHGHGLGLAITQEIVEAHGGKISVSSEGAGKGSTFTVWLPSAS